MKPLKKSNRLNQQSQKLKKILRILKKEFPNPHCALSYRNPFELLVATMLSAQATDKSVNQATPKLFKNFKTPQEFAKADVKEIEDNIRSIGLYKTKAKNIKKMAQLLIDEYNQKVPQSIDELIQLPGVGRKTANVVLGDAFGISQGICVDTHVGRISTRLGFSPKPDAIITEKKLMELCPKKDWIVISHLFILHGRKTCNARRPLCSECKLKPLCDWSLKNATA